MLRAVKLKSTDGGTWALLDCVTGKVVARGFESEDEAVTYIASNNHLGMRSSESNNRRSM
jgi:hypothetical protein